MAKRKGLSLRVQWLGSRLKRARLDAGATLAEAAEYVELSSGSISRFETGTLRVKRPYLKELIDFYGISQKRERDALMQLNEDAWRKDWWEGSADDLELGFLDHTWLESRADKICASEPLVIHGLLQTPEYARAVTVRGLGPTTSKETINRMVELRTTRQRILNSESPTRLEVIMEEPALRRPIGGKQVLKAQLEHLLEASRTATISIHILPNSVDWDPGHTGPFTVFNMPDPFTDVAFTDNLAGRTFLEDEAKVARFRAAYDDIYNLALNQDESARFIHTVIKELE